MPSYGPWTQEDDYDISVRWLNQNRVRALDYRMIPTERSQSAEFMFYGEGWQPVEDGSMMEALAAASLNPAVPAGADLDFGTTLTRLHPNGTVGEDNWGSGGRAEIRHHPWFAAPGRVSSSDDAVAPLYYYPGDSVGDFVEYPPGAIGLEFDDPTGEGIAQWLTVHIDAASTLGALNADDSDGSDPQPITAPATTEIVVQSIADATSNPNGGTQAALVTGIYSGDELALGEDIDITEHMSDDGVVIYTLTDHFMVPVHSDNYSLFNQSNRWTYGFWFEELRLRIHVRPPRYRWVYDTVPIQQTSHRDDHLAGGAYQTWPVPTSRQQSNTTFGGYL